ncbi:MAG: response regulator transcription factor [Bacteroidetes bacterium]|nr:response regulator transcription factor [Bacteroidota bacterium]
MNAKILIVDDEIDIVEFIRYNLEKEGYEVESASSGTEAIRKAREFEPALIVLDVMMPEMDGISACREIRKIEKLNNTFIMFLTARDEEFSEIAGFEAGGNDYVHKPIKPRALMSRINAIMKRSETQTEVEGEILNLGDITIDPTTRLVTVSGLDMSLPKKEFELLHLLASKVGKVFTRDKILRRVWGEDVYVVDRTIDVHIRKLREKIGDKRIETIKGVGYKFVG